MSNENKMESPFKGLEHDIHEGWEPEEIYAFYAWVEKENPRKPKAAKDYFVVVTAFHEGWKAGVTHGEYDGLLNG